MSPRIDDSGGSREQGYRDPNHPGNSARYHTGKECIEPDCHEPAGTWWSPLWCFQHNVARIERIDRRLEEFARSFAAR